MNQWSYKTITLYSENLAVVRCVAVPISGSSDERGRTALGYNSVHILICLICTRYVFAGTQRQQRVRVLLPVLLHYLGWTGHTWSFCLTEPKETGTSISCKADVDFYRAENVTTRARSKRGKYSIYLV